MVIDLSGLWQFAIDSEDGSIQAGQALQNPLNIAVPASFNDQFPYDKIRRHAGYFWYERQFQIPSYLKSEQFILRFGSATHNAWVYLNGEEICQHKGSFTPFEVEIQDKVKIGPNLLQVRLNNLLDHSCLPVGNYSQTKDTNGHIQHHVDENFDFFNYAGLHRPVKIYTRPKTHIGNISLNSDINFTKQTATVHVTVETSGNFAEISYRLLDANDKEEASYTAAKSSPNALQTANLDLEQVKLWQPLNAYLYQLEVNLYKSGQLVDSYTEPYGIRSVKVQTANSKSTINLSTSKASANMKIAM